MDDRIVKVGHVFNEFCPRSSMLRYWPVVNPHVKSAVYCFQRTNADLYPHDEVYTERWATRLRALPNGPWRRLSRPCAAVAHRLAWKRFLKRSKVDVLHVQFGDKAVRFLPMLNRTELPLLVTFRGSDINCASYSEAMCIGLRKLFARTSICHFVSEDLRQKAIQLGCPPEIARTIHVGAPPRREDERSTVSKRVDDCRFVCVASLLPCKGHETLLSAFQQICLEKPRATLHLLGDGPLRHRLMWVCQTLGIQDRVQFHGQLENAAVLSFLRSQADVVVLASQHDDAGNQEGLPTSLQEAASVGLPCIGTQCGGIPELIVDGQTGFVVPQRGVQQLAAAMCQMASDPSLRERMGRAAFARGRQYFNLDSSYAQIAACYQQMVASTRPDVASQMPPSVVGSASR